jgi:hypothetical protein
MTAAADSTLWASEPGYQSLPLAYRVVPRGLDDRGIGPRLDIIFDHKLPTCGNLTWRLGQKRSRTRRSPGPLRSAG